jgi:hypothetical protein
MGQWWSPHLAKQAQALSSTPTVVPKKKGKWVGFKSNMCL